MTRECQHDLRVAAAPARDRRRRTPRGCSGVLRVHRIRVFGSGCRSGLNCVLLLGARLKEDLRLAVRRLGGALCRSGGHTCGHWALRLASQEMRSRFTRQRGRGMGRGSLLFAHLLGGKAEVARYAPAERDFRRMAGVLTDSGNSEFASSAPSSIKFRSKRAAPGGLRTRTRARCDSSGCMRQRVSISKLTP